MGSLLFGLSVRVCLSHLSSYLPRHSTHSFPISQKLPMQIFSHVLIQEFHASGGTGTPFPQVLKARYPPPLRCAVHILPPSFSSGHILSRFMERFVETDSRIRSKSYSSEWRNPQNRAYDRRLCALGGRRLSPSAAVMVSECLHEERLMGSEVLAWLGCRSSKA
jgi:hypothetical protein